MRSLELYISDDGKFEGSYNQVKEYEDSIKATLMEHKQERYDKLSEMIKEYVRDYGELKVRCKDGEVRHTEDAKCEDITKEEKKDIFNRVTENKDSDKFDWLDWFFI